MAPAFDAALHWSEGIMNPNSEIIMNLMNALLPEQSVEVERQLTSQLGLSPEQAASVLPALGPLILGILKQDLAHHGPEHVEARVQQFGATDFSDLGAMLRQGVDGGGAGSEDLFGGKSQQVTQQFANQLGISAATAAKIIPMVAPLILGMLMKKGKAQGAGGRGWISILDRDGDGSILDDIGGMVAGGRGAAGKAGCLSAILGGLLRGKR